MPFAAVAPLLLSFGFSLPFASPQIPAPFLQDFGPSLVTDCPNPEGIAVDLDGRILASSFASGASANVCVLDHAGKLLRVLRIDAGPSGKAALLGMLFSPRDGLFVADFADGTAPHGRLLRIDPAGHVTTVTDGFAAPNAIAMDARGRLYVSDSFAGTITRVNPDGSGRTTWASDPRLTTTGQPPFGANGIAFDLQERFLYVANTGEGAVLRIPVNADGSAGPIEPFARGADLDDAADSSQSLHGADGIAFDERGNLWVCANQANELQVLSPDAEIIARYRGGGAAALDFPASLVFAGRTIYLTNLSLATGGVHSKLSVMTAPVRGARPSAPGARGRR